MSQIPLTGGAHSHLQVGERAPPPLLQVATGLPSAVESLSHPAPQGSLVVTVLLLFLVRLLPVLTPFCWGCMGTRAPRPLHHVLEGPRPPCLPGEPSPCSDIL